MTIGVSIILATYNRARLILETLASIQNQTYTNWECLIVDDGGTDTTFEILQPLLSSDSRFSYQKRPSSYLKGLPGCRNFGLDIAKGETLIFFDDDDIVHPQNLELSLQGINSNAFDFCLYQKQSLSENHKLQFKNEVLQSGQEINHTDLEQVITNSLPMASCTVLWQKQFIGNQRFNEQLLYAEEWEFYTRLIANGLKGISINNTLYFNRKHPQSNTAEYNTNDPIRRASKKTAIELMVQNLYAKGYLSQPILRYLIQLSLQFKEFNLFERILVLANVSTTEKWKWTIFYQTLPFRLKVNRFLKAIFK